MKSIVRKAVSLSGVAAVLFTCAGLAAAENTTEIKGGINKPYMNVSVTGEEADGLEFKLVNSDGDIVASWTGSDYSSAEIASGYTDITGLDDLSGLEVDAFTVGDSYLYGYDADDLEYFYNYQDGELVRKYYSVPDKLELDLGHKYTLTTNIYQDIEATDLTLEAGQYAIAVDSGYAEKEYSSGIVFDWSDSSVKYEFNSLSGVNVYSDYDAGKYALGIFIRNTSGGNPYEAFNIYDCSTEYAKVKINISDLTGGYFNSDGTIEYSAFGETYTVDPRAKTTENGNVAFYFVSGSVFTAPIPDEDGNVEIYVSKDTYSVNLYADFYVGTVSGGGKNAYSCNDPRELLTFETVVDTNLDIPETGITLYDIPAGEYTIEIDSDEYVLENYTFTATDTTDLQTFNAVLKTVEDSSSEDSSSEEDSSSQEDSLSGTSSSDIDSSSEDDSSSEASSSDDDSSVTSSDQNSSSSSGSTSSSGSSSNSGSDSNPATGAAVGFSGIALVAGAAIVCRKNR